MHVVYDRKPLKEVWWVPFALTVSAPFVDWLVAALITLAFRPWQPYANMHPLQFQKWKFPYELAGLGVVLVLEAVCLINHLYASILLHAAVFHVCN